MTASRKNYLELLALYVSLLKSKRQNSIEMIDKLSEGTRKLNETNASVETLKEELEAHTKLWKLDEIRSPHGTTTLLQVAVENVPDIEFYGRLVGYQPWLEWTAASKHTTPISIEWADVPEV